MSISGGVSTAPVRAESVGAHSIQIFTKNNNQWSGKPLTPEEIEKFGALVVKLHIDVFASHDCYLINLASPDATLLEKSRKAFLDEIDRADALNIPCLVFHPGAHTGAGEADGLKRVAESLNHCLAKRPASRVTLTLETTAGQGTSLGYKFEHLAWIIDNVEKPERMGVCLDTCHVFAAGYEINTEKGYEHTFDEFDKIIGLARLKMFHVNDSKKELNSRVDRHEHIGRGHIGLPGFKMLVTDKRFLATPMILETPKRADGYEDKINLAVLRGLAEGKSQLTLVDTAKTGETDNRPLA